MNLIIKLSKTDLVLHYTFLVSVAFSFFMLLASIMPISIWLLPVYFLVLCLVGFFIFKYPEIGVYLILIQLMIFERVFTLSPFFIGNKMMKIYPVDFIIFLTLSALFFRRGFSQTISEVINKIKDSFAAKMILIWASLATVYFVVSLFIEKVNVALSLNTWKNYAFYTIIYFLTIFIIKTPIQVKRFLKIFLVVALLLISFLGIGFINGQGIWVEINELSTQGVRYLANSHALYLMPAIFFGFCLLAFGRKLYGKFTVFIVLIQIFAVIMSLFRHLWLGLIFSFGLIFFSLDNYKKKNILKFFLKMLVISVFVFCIFVLVANILMLDFGNNFNLIKNLELRWQSLIHYQRYFDVSAMWRISVWSQAISMFRANWLFGIGFGRELVVNFLGVERSIPMRDLHNEWLGIILQTGILGFSFISVLFIHLVNKTVKFYRLAPQNVKPHILAISTFLVTYVFMSNFNVYFNANLFIIFFWFFLAILLNIGEFYESKKN